MARSDARMQTLARRIMLARMRILSEQGFFGLLLMHMKFAIGDDLDTAWVSSDTITFNPDFMDELNDRELAFVLEHEVMHAALGHVTRGRTYENHEQFNVACDIVVNSNILRSHDMDLASITLGAYGESMHLTPAGDEGFYYTAEEVYDMLPKLELPDDRTQSKRWDWHIVSDEEDVQDESEVWIQRIREARDAMRARDPENQRGLVPLGIVRLLGELDAPKADWRALLNDFVQEEVFDWSFQVPDTRYADSPFIMPGYSDVESVVHDVVFMVDTSGSVSQEQLTEAFSELRGSLEQFAGRLDGWVGFFDAVAYKPIRFESVADLESIRPRGGGGTSFEAVFEGIDKYLSSEDISCIVIITDGMAPYPDESMARGIPVLWLLTEKYNLPPWGRVALIS